MQACQSCESIAFSLAVHQVYTFSKGQIKPANMKFATLKHQYELTFDRNTAFELVRILTHRNQAVTMLWFCDAW